MYAFVDPPRRRSPADYVSATERFVSRMSEAPGVLAIYQLGSVSDPGISDLDFLVVTADGHRSETPPLATTPAADRCLIVHAPFGIAVRDFRDAVRFGCFHNYRHLWGDVLPTEPERGAEETTGLERQVALEYLVQMYVNLTLQRAYGVFKLRGFFLHVRALLYDLDFLAVEDDSMRELVERLVGWRRVWLKDPVAPATLSASINELAARLPSLVDDAIARHGFYLPGARFALAPNISLSRGERLSSRRSGLVLPRLCRGLGAVYFKLQNRLNRFAFECAFESSDMPDLLAERFAFLARLRRYHAEHLPGFMRPTSSLNAA